MPPKRKAPPLKPKNPAPRARTTAGGHPAVKVEDAEATILPGLQLARHSTMYFATGDVVLLCFASTCSDPERIVFRVHKDLVSRLSKRVAELFTGDHEIIDGLPAYRMS